MANDNVNSTHIYLIVYLVSETLCESKHKCHIMISVKASFTKVGGNGMVQLESMIMYLTVFIN